MWEQESSWGKVHDYVQAFFSLTTKAAVQSIAYQICGSFVSLLFVFVGLAVPVSLLVRNWGAQMPVDFLVKHLMWRVY